MSDLYDRATEAEERFREHALQAQRDKLRRGESAKRCADCGERIPAARRRALPGVSRCVDCEDWRERTRR